MPGEFYIKGKKEKTDLSQVLAGITQLEATGDAIKARTDNLAGEAPETGSTTLTGKRPSPTLFHWERMTPGTSSTRCCSRFITWLAP